MMARLRGALEDAGRYVGLANGSDEPDAQGESLLLVAVRTAVILGAAGLVTLVFADDGSGGRLVVFVVAVVTIAVLWGVGARFLAQRR